MEHWSVQQRIFESGSSLATFHKNPVMQAEVSAKSWAASSALAKAIFAGLLQRANFHQAAVFFVLAIPALPAQPCWNP